MAVAVQPRGTAGADMPASAVALRAVGFAQGMIGVPYVWGGVTPNGFDCSGLCEWAYDQAGLKIPRTSSEQAHAGYPSVQPGNYAPGDLIFSDWPGDSGPSPGHVVMYIGNGRVVAAPHTGTTVQDEDLSVFLGIPYRGACRPSSGPAAGLAGAPTAPAAGADSSPFGGAGGAVAGLGLGLGALIVGGLLVAGVVAYFVFRHKKGIAKTAMVIAA